MNCWLNETILHLHTGLKILDELENQKTTSQRLNNKFLHFYVSRHLGHLSLLWCDVEISKNNNAHAAQLRNNESLLPTTHRGELTLDQGLHWLRATASLQPLRHEWSRWFGGRSSGVWTPHCQAREELSLMKKALKGFFYASCILIAFFMALAACQR